MPFKSLLLAKVRLLSKIANINTFVNLLKFSSLPSKVIKHMNTILTHCGQIHQSQPHRQYQSNQISDRLFCLEVGLPILKSLLVLYKLNPNLVAKAEVQRKM